MNKYLSDKLRIISLISMIMVVFLHSNNIIVKYNSGNINYSGGYSAFLQNFISDGITRIAVPVFFCISGYLFFLNFRGTIEAFILKYRKRAKSLLLPYLLWSIWGLFIYYIIQLFPQSKNFFTDELVVNYSFIKVLDTIFLHPITYQLWFVRDLIVIALISPLIYFATKYFRAIPIIFLVIIWLGLFNFSFVIFENESIFFFCLGSYFVIDKSEYLMKKMSRNYYWVFTLIWLLIIFLKTALAHQNYDQTVFLLLLHKISIIIGIMALWSIYDIAMTNKTTPNKVIFNLSYYSFFIYVFHEPTLKFIKKGLFYIIGSSEIISIIVYFLAPIMTIIVCVIVAIFIKRNTPKVYELITGGR